MNYTFYNRGAVSTFNPKQTVKGPDGSSITMLDFHKELVHTTGRRDVYITDNKGREVSCDMEIA